MKTDQEILEELKQAGGGERRRSFGLTAFIVLLAIIIGVFTYINRKDETNNTTNTNNTNVAQNTNNTANTSNAATNESNKSNETASNESNTANVSNSPSVESNQTVQPATGEAVGETPNAQSTHSETAYTETTQAGEGVTHLARRALHGYLSDRGITDLTAEHKVFIEDYLAKNSGASALEIGNTRTFETATLDQAIAAARALTPSQLQNLQQYSAQVPGL